MSGGPQAVHPPGPLSSAVEPATVMMPDPDHRHPIGEHTAAHQYAASPMAGTVPGDRHGGVDATLEEGLSSTPHADGGGSQTPAPVATLDIVATLPVVQVWIPEPDKGVSSDVNLQHRPLGSDAPCDPRAIQGWLCLEVTGAEARFQQATPFPMACTIATPVAPPVHTVDRHTIAPTAVEVPKDPTVRLDDALFAAITRSVQWWDCAGLKQLLSAYPTPCHPNIRDAGPLHCGHWLSSKHRPGSSVTAALGARWRVECRPSRPCSHRWRVRCMVHSSTPQHHGYASHGDGGCRGGQAE